jgi:ubiquinone/menaquinone biosynthesis C-methylase UbiE
MKSRLERGVAMANLAAKRKTMGVEGIIGLDAAALPVDPAHEWLRNTYDRTADKYRAQDEEHISGRDYQRVSQVLREVTSSFNREIRVLDLGCGTGRYFHCVQNARELVGLDLSQQMLDAARNPVRADEVTARKVTLVKGDLFSAKFEDGHFDFIYCLGVFGNGCAIGRAAYARIRHWLAPGGMWLFDALDVASLPLSTRIRKGATAQLYSLLPRAVKTRWVQRSGWPPFFGTNVQRLRSGLQKSGFEIEWITSRRSQLPAGAGFKIEVLCKKAG